MELKDFQDRVLGIFDAYLDELSSQRAKAEKIIKANAEENDPDLIREVPDFPAKAWTSLKAQGKLPEFRKKIPYSPRYDGIRNSVPNACFKVPTGGGKTLLAASAVSHVINKYIGKNTGVVLWIVPNEAIYAQTRKHLTNREHPYRQVLDKAGAGKVKILEKDDRLDRRDVESHLCVMLLMLQAANRETQETLRIFRDRGNVHGFFPVSDDIAAHFSLLDSVPNLSCYGDKDNLGAIVHDSLGNAMRFIRPVVVMDEGHKGYSNLAMKTLYDFNPCFVLELSATPKDRPKDSPPKYSNWLVDIRGTDLAAEDMVKLPINVKVKSGDDWRDCLRESLEQLNRLQSEADKLHANTARYIRPILLVQVERTGKEQREAGFIHADNAREYLLTLGLNEQEIAVKTSEINDLKSPENMDLLKPTCPVRIIITKQALQEGWDCPFAYILCTLSANRNMNAMTQLVGRILRQPDTQKIGYPALDECYVFCNHTTTKDIVAVIKKGLEEDGMADLADKIREEVGEPGGEPNKPRTINRRDNFRSLRIFLPVVNWVENGKVRPLDYEQDILMRLDWQGINVDQLADTLAENVHTAPTHVFRINFTNDPKKFIEQTAEISVSEKVVFDPIYATRIISDIVPNPWIARSFIGQLINRLKRRGFDEDKLGTMSSYILEELRKTLLKERDRLAEVLFMANVAIGKIQFRLRTDKHNWETPSTLETNLPENAKLLYKKDGKVVGKNLFSPVYEDDFNTFEAEFACYLDEGKALKWWHRNVARSSNSYFIQGWRKHKVYPDFIFAMKHDEDGEKLVVLETKGDQLEGNLDTKYKQKLLNLMSKEYRFENVVNAGKLELIVDSGTVVICDIVLESNWKTELHNRFLEQQKDMGQGAPPFIGNSKRTKDRA